MGKVIDLTGQKFGRLTVIKRDGYADDITKKEIMWLCQCNCDKHTILRVRGVALRNGNTQSCGCYSSEKTIERNKKYATKHNMTNTRFYQIWRHMRQRCYKEYDKHYKYYGQKGIQVCDQWMDKENGFMNFYNDMYNSYIEHCKIHSEKETTLDRIDFDRNYEPNNCRWATLEIQANNKSNNKFIEINGEIHTIADWSKLKNIPRKTLEYRVRNNWDSKDLFIPVDESKAKGAKGKEKHYHYITINNETLTMKEWSEKTGIKYATIKNRVYHGCEGEDIIKPIEN